MSSCRSCFLLHVSPLLLTAAGCLLSPRLGASDTQAVFLPGHLREHVGGKLDCAAGSGKYDLLERLDGGSWAFWKLREVCGNFRKPRSCGLWCERPELAGEAVTQVQPPQWTCEGSETQRGDLTSPGSQSSAASEAGP